MGVLSQCHQGITPYAFVQYQAQVAPAFAQLLAPHNVRFVRGSVASVEPQETASNGSAASGARPWMPGARLPESWA